MKRRCERGLSNSVQAAVLFPLGLAIFLGLVQWALVAWAESTAVAAAQQGAAVAARFEASGADGQAAALSAAGNGSLESVTVQVSRGASQTTATVSGRCVVVLWPMEISKTVVVSTERVTRP
ncbi:MAG: TadE/TadG family type IV pilus assembly protein [Propionibacteriaceae bacterium]|nr:TadE/TadG family type IV pilus assembly protein [Propionibacteriaceae bacterium]